MNDLSFGDYLRTLIKQAGMTQTQFYTSLGITKPYFYDILSGRVSPPPPELQFKSIEILGTDGDARTLFFDLAAKDRGEVPADIARWINTHPSMIKDIRNSMNEQTILEENYGKGKRGISD